MNDHIDTRDGWREVKSGEEPGAERVIWSAAGSHNPDRVWVRGLPVPPLPTEDKA